MTAFLCRSGVLRLASSAGLIFAQERTEDFTRDLLVDCISDQVVIVPGIEGSVELRRNCSFSCDEFQRRKLAVHFDAEIPVRRDIDDGVVHCILSAGTVISTTKK